MLALGLVGILNSDGDSKELTANKKTTGVTFSCNLLVYRSYS